ncbi:MAG: RsmE family RNA methyltransferase [Anaerolineales bacterium]|jgi:16S rRNA (uracil1498-N3)-methyltransferase
MHRFFVPPNAIHSNRVEFPERAAHQIRNVFHMNPGDRVKVLDDSGWEYQVALQLVSRKAVIGDVELRALVENEPEVELTLFAALLKKDNFEWVLQKCTELGIGIVVPILTERTVMAEPSDHKLERWHRIVMEAAEQSGRGRLPRLEDPIDLDQALERLSDFSQTLFFWEEARQGDLRQVIGGDWVKGPLACMVGPEGGFSEDEAQRVQAAGGLPISLGPRILRAETAAVVVTALVMYELGGLSRREGER